MESPRNEDLLAGLRELRPSPSTGFAAELDAKAAAGFPGPERGARSLPRRLAERLRALPPRRLIATAGACAVATIAVATAVVVTIEDGQPGSRELLSLTDENQSGSPSPKGMRIHRSGLERFGGGVNRLAGPPPVREFSAPLRGQGQAKAQRAEALSGSSAASAGPLLAQPASGNASAAQANDAASALQELNGGRPSVGPYASRAGHRDIERSARLLLATEASEVRAAATKVFETVHSYDGIVLSSSIRAAGRRSGSRHVRPPDPQRQAQRCHGVLLANRRGALSRRGDSGHHRTDDWARGKAAGRPGQGREPARAAGGGDHRGGARGRRSEASRRAPACCRVARPPRRSQATSELLARLAANRKRQRGKRRCRRWLGCGRCAAGRARASSASPPGSR